MSLEAGPSSGQEQIAGGGYDVALHLPGSDQYTVWGADSTGNVISNATRGIVSGASSALEPLYLSSTRILNGDGTIWSRRRLPRRRAGSGQQ